MPADGICQTAPQTKYLYTINPHQPKTIIPLLWQSSLWNTYVMLEMPFPSLIKQKTKTKTKQNKTKPPNKRTKQKTETVKFRDADLFGGKNIFLF